MRLIQLGWSVAGVDTQVLQSSGDVARQRIEFARISGVKLHTWYESETIKWPLDATVTSDHFDRN